jgi:alpha-beta hydrolase superfamily lysophospholipase
MKLERRECTFAGAGDMQLFGQAWLPEQPPRAVVALVHGFGEHGGRYTYLAEALTGAGYVLSTFDHRGHGRSPGLRGHVDRADQFLADIKASLVVAKDLAPAVPLFLFGHSMGGLLALNYAIRSPEGLFGVIASAPLLSQPNVAPWMTFAAGALSRIKPDFSFDTGVKPETISRDPAEVKRYRDDPYVHGRASARLGTEVPTAQTWTQAHAGELRIPLLLYHGTDDPLVPIAGSRTFFANVKVADKEWIEWPGGYHESHNDLHRGEVFTAVLNWLERHVAA